MTKKRIMMISEHASPMQKPGAVDSGGQNVYVDHVSRELAELGYAVDVFTRGEDPTAAPVVDWKPGVRIVNVPAGPECYVRKEEILPYMDEFAAACIRHARRKRYDLIHANFWMSGLVASAVKQALGIPFVITFHALGGVRRLHQARADEFPDERFEIEERIMQEADCILAECPQDREDMLTLYAAPVSRIAIVPCGVDPLFFSPVPKSVARAAIGVPEASWVVLQLGRMVPRKGIDNVIEALAILSRDYGRRAELIVVGGDFDDPAGASSLELDRLRTLGQREGVAQQVHFVGRKQRGELKHYYSAADVFVTTPWYEPFGITPLEAMACGTPVIGSNVGGIKYSIEHGATGYLVPPKRPDVLALQLDYLQQNPVKVRQLAKEGLRRVLNYFTWKQVADMMVNVYEDVLREHAANQPRRRRSEKARRQAEVVALKGLRARRAIVAAAAPDRGEGRTRTSAEYTYRSARAVFIEKDDVILENLHTLGASERLVLADNAALGLRMLQAYGFKLILISHQPDIAHGLIDERTFTQQLIEMEQRLAEAGVRCEGCYYCPHHPNATVSTYAVVCECRKPSPGLLLQAAEKHRFDLRQSWLIGKILDDVEAGKRAGCRSLLLTRQNESAWKFLRPTRRPDAVAASVDQAAHFILDLESQYSNRPSDVCVRG